MTNETPPPRTAWRFFPWYLSAAILLVVAVNAAMITTAVNSFPGKVGRNGFDLSNQYNGVLAAAERARALGWTVSLAAEGGALRLELSDGAGAPLSHAAVRGEIRRPVGVAEAQALAFAPAADGSLRAPLAAIGPGQWDVTLTIETASEIMRLTRRLSLK